MGTAQRSKITIVPYVVRSRSLFAVQEHCYTRAKKNTASMKGSCRPGEPYASTCMTPAYRTTKSLTTSRSTFPPALLTCGWRSSSRLAHDLVGDVIRLTAFARASLLLRTHRCPRYAQELPSSRRTRCPSPRTCVPEDLR